MSRDDRGGSAYASRTETKWGVVDNSFNKGKNTVLRDIATQLNCFPTHSSVHRKLDTLRADNERMREALEWYSLHVDNCGTLHGVPRGDESRDKLSKDRGQRAREALSPNTKDTPDDAEL